MDYPYYKCLECETEIAELSLPIHPQQKYPKCPKCKTDENVDIVLGNENTVIGDENTVIFSDNPKKLKGSD